MGKHALAADQLREQLLAQSEENYILKIFFLESHATAAEIAAPASAFSRMMMAQSAGSSSAVTNMPSMGCVAKPFAAKTDAHIAREEMRKSAPPIKAARAVPDGAYAKPA